jgi:hypothetical protein
MRAIVKNTATINNGPNFPGNVYYQLRSGTVLELGPTMVTQVSTAKPVIIHGGQVERGTGVQTSWVRVTLQQPAAGDMVDVAHDFRRTPVTVPAGVWWTPYLGLEILQPPVETPPPAPAPKLGLHLLLFGLTVASAGLTAYWLTSASVSTASMAGRFLRS